ncbi:unnamed protein product [Cylicostephanus goldi]|uniref:N-acetylgalactosaminide beta-1,3-galactosyltransferase n=1 Tax=Cylicostephanus goldi TaxID=71465 RepID=A0A3P6S9A4_CYLGO|nr:unnamed protein product [Cylicostephanus goldi]
MTALLDDNFQPGPPQSYRSTRLKHATFAFLKKLKAYIRSINPVTRSALSKLRKIQARGYNGGGAGYVLSRAAVKLLLQRGYGDRKACPFDYSEDVGMGMCLQNMEIYPHDTRNERGQQRFHTYRPDDMFHGKILDEWHYYRQINVSPTFCTNGFNGLTVRSVSRYTIQIRFFFYWCRQYSIPSITSTLLPSLYNINNVPM